MPGEEDRRAIEDLIGDYARCADRRDVARHLGLFRPDARFTVYGAGSGPPAEPVLRLRGREELRPLFESLNAYQATTHFLGQSMISVDGRRATGETYCLAHHLPADPGRTLMIAAVRYLDEFARGAGGDWLFAARTVLVDWTETRP
jgi:hypothetical protein